jgi:hypothetical protein
LSKKKQREGVREGEWREGEREAGKEKGRKGGRKNKTRGSCRYVQGPLLGLDLGRHSCLR